MTDELVSIAAFDYPETAHILRAKLESENIEAYLIDENVAAMFWHYSPMTKGVKLQVKQSDAPKARQIIGEKLPDPTPSQTQQKETRCPQCDSSDVFLEPSRRGLFIILILTMGLVPVAGARLGLPLAVQALLHAVYLAALIIVGVHMCKTRKHTCADCHHQWKQKQTPTYH